MRLQIQCDGDNRSATVSVSGGDFDDWMQTVMDVRERVGALSDWHVLWDLRAMHPAPQATGD